MTAVRFLSGVPEDHVLARLASAGGDEIDSGKLASPESSAALAVNAFGWFVPRPELLPLLPGIAAAGVANRVEVEYCARFPWRGGTHPWLDAAIFSASHLVGVESKHYEPFRDFKKPTFSSAYDRPVWGQRMGRYSSVRDALRSGQLVYRHLDATQLVEHAYGLATDARRLGLQPHLVYVFAEPAMRGNVRILDDERLRHRDEVADFAARVLGDEVEFGCTSYREWLAGAIGPAKEHAAALLEAFDV